MEPPVEFTIPAIRPNGFFDFRRLTLEYDAESDSFYLYDEHDRRPATSVHLGDSLYARVDPGAGDLLGFHIEGYKRVFLVRNRPVREAWLALFDSEAEAEAVRDFAQALAHALIGYLRRHATGTASAERPLPEHGETRFVISAHA